MSTVRDVVEIMERWAPPSLAETWDNPGLMTGAPRDPVTGVLISLDVTIGTLEAARRTGASLVISHHPPIFRPLRSLAGNSLSHRVIRAALREGIALYSAHTNLDQAPGGVSYALAERLGLRSVTPLAPDGAVQVKFVTFVPPEFTDRVREAAASAGAGVIGEYRYCSFSVRGTGTYLPSESAHPFAGESGMLSRAGEDRIEMILPVSAADSVVSSVRAVHPYEEMAYDLIPLSNTDPRFGYGAIGTLNSPLEYRDFVRMVSDILRVDRPYHSGNPGRVISRVAVMGGSGAKYIGHALAAGVDAYVTGEIGYHDFLEIGDSLLLLDATHRATELPVLDAIRGTLEKQLADTVTITIDPGAALPYCG